MKAVIGQTKRYFALPAMAIVIAKLTPEGVVALSGVNYIIAIAGV